MERGRQADSIGLNSERTDTEISSLLIEYLGELRTNNFSNIAKAVSKDSGKLKQAHGKEEKAAIYRHLALVDIAKATYKLEKGDIVGASIFLQGPDGAREELRKAEKLAPHHSSARHLEDYYYTAAHNAPNF